MEVGAMELMSQGRLFLIKNCTKIRKIDTSGASVQVRILEEQEEGVPTAGWVSYEFAVKTN